MKVSFSVDNQREFYEELQDKLGTNIYIDDFERRIQIHPRIGEGRIHSFQFSSGLELQIQEYLTQKPISLAAEINYTNLGIFWVLAGNSHYSLEDNQFDLKPQQNIISYCSNVRGCFNLAANKKVIFVGMSLEKYLESSRSSIQQKQLPNHLYKLFQNNSNDIFWQNDRTTAEMNLVLQQIINCPYQGITKQVYLESKSLELIALKLAQLEEKNISRKYQPKKEELERLYYAREIVLNNIDNPPSLYSLAKQIGLNEYKLKQGFKAVFNNTVFGYLHNYRMEKSHLLLRSGTMNVTEVAQTVGYTNLSHFAAAFRKKYGVNPSVFKQID